MSTKILPISTNPPVRGYQFFAYQLSVICSTENYMSWLNSHFIQLYCNPEEPIVSFYETYIWYDSNPWFEFERFSHESIDTLGIDFEKIIKSYIDREYYVLSVVDEYYLPCKGAYQEYNNIHDLLILGYELNSKHYITIGYDFQGEYKIQRIDFSSVNQSFFAAQENYIIPFKLNKNYKHNINIDNIIELINDYIYSRDTSARIKPLDERQQLSKHVFGIETYKSLIKYFELIIENKVQFDIRSLHFLYEHKKCMLTRIEFFIERGFLVDDNNHFVKEYRIIMEECLSARNLQLKFGITRNNRYIMKVITILEKIIEQERRLLIELVGRLKDTNV